ncbi:hypothetical protein JQS43_08255 [Natronosporangium hydrolyticum]|uniref:Uncharacterized protein n=1 Tax=Natronosporangium hydrolyticum TaxID=2811111 RepID=A0A895YQ70_9ACTN|nr:hypothetical protein [Natronosporangium hydrolyticum]QSB16270.1 hypothetical protein JQS43_08255 [Natronosporangium hydrolyticum]
MRTPREPEIHPVDAEDLLAEPYRTVTEALAVGRRLRAAGWVVIEHVRCAPAPAGLRMVASVYHPISYESPGDLWVRGGVAPEAPAT